MLNVMEERDIQIRGYVLRLPLDVLVVASANPEDYTNRGRIITPLKDRFGAEIRTHYPTELDDEIAVIRQEADLVAEVPDHLVEILARFTRNLRESSAVDQRSGVSARFAIAGAETIAAAALHRATAQGEDEAGRPRRRPRDRGRRARRQDRVRDRRGGPRGRDPHPPAPHRRRRDRPRAPRRHRPARCWSTPSRRAPMVSTGDQVGARDFLAGLPVLGESDLYDEVCDRLGATNDGERAGGDRARPRGALPRPQDRQGHRRPGRPSMADAASSPWRSARHASTTSRPCAPSARPSCRRPTARSTRRTPSGCSTSGGPPRSSRRRWSATRHVVAEVDGEVVALANLGRLSQSYRDFPHVTGDREVMWKLYVHPDHQGRGIGSRLLARRRGARRGRRALAGGRRRQRRRPSTSTAPTASRRSSGSPTATVARRRLAPQGQLPGRARDEPLPQVRRRRPARAAGRPRRGARRHRPGRDGRLLAGARDARVPAARGHATRPASTSSPAASPSAAARSSSATTSTARCARSRELLDKAVLAERGQLARDITMDDGDRAFREIMLDNLPSSTPAAVERAVVVRLAVLARRARPTRRSRTCSAASCSTSASPA